MVAMQNLVIVRFIGWQQIILFDFAEFPINKLNSGFVFS
jgi:hypothetical protein